MSKTLALFFSSLIPFSLFSNSYTVSSPADTGAGTLRQAILDSNTNGGSNTININSGLGTITLASSLPIITNQATIVGPATPQVLNANGYRAFFFYSPFLTLTPISISNVTIQQGNVTGGSGANSALVGAGGGGGAGLGGAVFVPPGATATLQNITFTSNTAVGGSGGTGQASLLGNAGGGGGGLFGNGGTGGISYPISVHGGGGGLQGNGGNATASEVEEVNQGGGGGGFTGNGADRSAGGTGGAPNGGAGAFNGANGGPGGGGGGFFSASPPPTNKGTGGSGGDGGGGGGGYGFQNEDGVLTGRSPSSNGGFGGGGGGILTGTPDGVVGQGGFGGGGGGRGQDLPDIGNTISGGFGGGGGGGDPNASTRLGGFGGGNSTDYGAGGGAGLGGALFIPNTSSVLLVDPSFSSNSAIGGVGGSPGGNNGSGIGQDIFLMSGGTLEFNLSAALIFPSPIESDQGAGGGTGGGLIKSGAGLLDFSTNNLANTYTGGTTINNGTLKIASDGNLGDSSGPVTLGNGTLEITTNSFTISRTTTLTGNATITVDTGVTTTWASGITGTGTFTTQGQGTLILTGSNSYLGATTVSSGALQAGAINTFSPQSSSFTVNTFLNLNSFNQSITQLLGSGTVALGSATLTIGSDNSSPTFLGMISGNGGLTKVGTGVFTLSGLSGNNAYGGATIVSGGTLRAGVANIFSPNSAFTVNTTLDLNGLDQTIAGLSGAGTVTLETGTLSVGNSGNPSTFQGMIQGTTGGLTKEGSGTFTLAGTSAYSGATTVSDGTLQAGATNAFSPNSAFTVNAALSLNGLNQSIANLNGSGMVLLGAGTLTFGSDNNPSAFSGMINGSGGLTKVGTGVFTLSGLSNMYSGATIVAAGTFQAGAINTFSLLSPIAVGGTLDLNSLNQSIANLTGAGLVRAF